MNNGDNQVVEKYVCDDMTFFTNIKESLRYESDLADRRLKFLLAIQTAIAGGYGYFAQQWQGAAVAVAIVGLVIAGVMFGILRKGELASRRIVQRWKRFYEARGLSYLNFPPVWGIEEMYKDIDVTERKEKNKDCDRGNPWWWFMRFFGVEPEYYVVLPLIIAACWTATVILKMGWSQ